MIKDYKQSCPGLELDIINEIKKIERRNLLVKQWFYEIISLASFVGIVSSTIYVIKTLSTSGIFGYISLIFSDIQALSYWKELSLSMLETLPFLEFAMGLGVLGIFLWSLLKTFKIQVIKNSIA